MTARILVAYATRYGSTQEVAEAIGARLRGQGLDVEVKPARDVRQLDGFAAVVLGTPLYIGSALKGWAAFVERHHAVLEQLPVAVFALGPISASDDMADARGQLDAALAKTPWLAPVAIELFVGKYDPAKLHLADKLIAVIPASPLHGVGLHDERDWDAIDAWADKLPEALSVESRASAATTAT